MEVDAILKATSFATSIAKYFGYIEDKLLVKLDLLANSELDAGMRALNQALRSNAQEQPHLLREARGRFNKAISLEKELRRAAAFLGLAMCHSLLEDEGNAREALTSLLAVKIDFDGGSWLPIVAGAVGTAILPGIGSVLGMIAGGFYGTHLKEQEFDAKIAPLVRRLDEVKQAVRAYLEQASQEAQAARAGPGSAPANESDPESHLVLNPTLF